MTRRQTISNSCQRGTCTYGYAFIWLLQSSLLWPHHSLVQAAPCKIEEDGFVDPLRGWCINQEATGNQIEDVSLLEWDLHTFHNRDFSFNGQVGYAIANPNGFLEGLGTPSGLSLAVFMERQNEAPIGNYENFHLDTLAFSDTEKYLQAGNPFVDDGLFATLEPITTVNSREPALRLQGRSTDFEWDLVVTQARKDLDRLREHDNAPFTAVRGTDVGILDTEVWTADAIWPRTNVMGQVKVRSTGEIIPIDAYGYREANYGSYLILLDGADWVRAAEEDENGVVMVMKSYHRSELLDNLDITFVEDGEMKAERFRSRDEEFGWFHPQWTFDERVNQCVPLSTRLRAENERYIVAATVDIGNRQAPLLSDFSPITETYFLQEQFSTVTGVVINKQTQRVVTEFTAQGSGEFTYLKRLATRADPPSDRECRRWGTRLFRTPFPR